MIRLFKKEVFECWKIQCEINLLFDSRIRLTLFFVGKYKNRVLLEFSRKLVKKQLYNQATFYTIGETYISDAKLTLFLLEICHQNEFMASQNRYHNKLFTKYQL